MKRYGGARTDSSIAVDIGGRENVNRNYKGLGYRHARWETGRILQCNGKIAETGIKAARRPGKASQDGIRALPGIGNYRAGRHDRMVIRGNKDGAGIGALYFEAEVKRCIGAYLNPAVHTLSAGDVQGVRDEGWLYAVAGQHLYLDIAGGIADLYMVAVFFYIKGKRVCTGSSRCKAQLTGYGINRKSIAGRERVVDRVISRAGKSDGGAVAAAGAFIGLQDLIAK